MNKFSELVEELREISPHAFSIGSPIYYWSVDDEGINGTAVRSNAIYIPLSLGIEEKQEWCNKLNACTKKIHKGAIFSSVGPNHKISMIKELRYALGLDLREAKQMVEDYLSTGKMRSLPFVLYSGVPELEGYGYLPFCENQPCPIEMAEVLGYTIAEKKQEVTPCTRWGVVFFLGSYLAIPHFPEDAALGWDGENVIIINNHYQSMMYSCDDKEEARVYSCCDRREASEIALLMNKAYKKGHNQAVEKMKGLLVDVL